VKSRGPMCRECLDWSARRPHLAGAVGRALLAHFYDVGWACRVEGSRVVRFSPAGKSAFSQQFPLILGMP